MNELDALEKAVDQARTSDELGSISQEINDAASARMTSLQAQLAPIQVIADGVPNIPDPKKILDFIKILVGPYQAAALNLTQQMAETSAQVARIQAKLAAKTSSVDKKQS